MLAYSYDKKTKEYIGTVNCQLDPLESKKAGKEIYLLPANATFISPLAKKENFAIVFNDDGWEYVIDYRGKNYWLPTDTWESDGHKVINLGELPQGASFEKPQIPLDVIKTNKVTELKQVRDDEELSPIAFGGYLWDFDTYAQMRINGAITVLGGNTITWTSANNEEIKLVNVDDLKGVVGAAAIRSNQLHIKYRDLKALVEKATSQAEVESIVW